MASAAAARPKEIVFAWEGKDKAGKTIRGEMRAGGTAVVNATLRRQGILVTKVRKQRIGRRGKVTEKDLSIFTRQLATMMKAGVPLLQSFEIVSKGASNPAVAKLLNEIKLEVETGSPLATAFRKHPLYFDSLYCNLVEAGEAGGILETLLERLAMYQEKTLAIKAKIKSALIYPVAVMVVAFIVVAVIMIFVIPAFKEVFTSFGADLPAPTLFVIAMSEVFVKWWWLIFGGIGWAFVNINSLPMVVELTTAARLGTFTGLYYLFSTLAAIVGPNLNGLAIQLTGNNYNVIMLIAPFFMLAALVLMLGVRRGEATSYS